MESGSPETRRKPVSRSLAPSEFRGGPRDLLRTFSTISTVPGAAFFAPSPLSVPPSRTNRPYITVFLNLRFAFRDRRSSNAKALRDQGKVLTEEIELGDEQK